MPHIVETDDAYLTAIKADFRNFLFLVWQHLNLPEPTEIQYDLADYLQHGPRRRVIEAFRGVGKSWITAAYVLWRLLINPDERILVVSASKDRSDAFSVFVKRLIEEMPLIQHLRPREGQRDSNIAFDVGPSAPHQAPSVRSVGITGQLTGGRATIIIADDVEVPKNSVTHTMREKLSELVKEFDAVLAPNGEVIYLGTPQTEMSLYNSLPARGYEVRIWPTRFPNGELLARYAGRLAPYIANKLAADPTLPDQCGGRGAPTDRKRFDDTDLLEREASYGRSGFSMQFMLDTSVSDQDRYPLKLSDLLVLGAIDPQRAPVSLAWGSGPEQIINHLSPVGLAGDRYHRPLFIHKEFIDYQGIVMTIDPSGRGGDETGYAVVAMLNGFLYVLRAGGLKGGYDDATLTALANIAKECKVKHVLIESNFGDGMFTKLLTPFLTRIHPVTTEEIHSVGQKEARILDVMEPVLNQHRLVVSEELIKKDAEVDPKYQLLFQLTRLTRERGALAKDDRIDVLSMAVAYWVEQMDKDVRKAADDHKAQALEAELAKFHDHVFGTKPVAMNWMATR